MNDTEEIPGSHSCYDPENTASSSETDVDVCDGRVFAWLKLP